MSDTGKTLPNLVREVIFFYVKHYYDKYLTTNNITSMNETHINEFIQQYYTSKEKELRDYVRTNLKKNLGPNYNSISVENILLEMSSDPDMAKERIKLEIQDYQNSRLLK
jgi:hypothetical protein